jgi:hypothetical protein
MSDLLKKLIVAFIFALSLPTYAGYAEGLKAYESGNYALALKEFQPIAQRGNADAQFLMSVMYFEGHGVEKNFENTFFLLCSAARQSHSKAQAVLEDLTKNGSNKVLHKTSKTPIYRSRQGLNPTLWLTNNEALWVATDDFSRGVFTQRSLVVYATDGLYDCGWTETQNIYPDLKYQQKLDQSQRNDRDVLANFRSTIKVGTETNCGPVIEVRGELVKVYAPVKDFGNEHWIRSDQIYPVGNECKFSNGRYIGR